jgi:hypothetical protein
MDTPIEAVVDFSALTLGDLETLESAKRAADMVAWLAAHAGLTTEAARAIPLKELRGLMEKLRDQITEAMALPKSKNGSSSPS